MVKSSWKVTSLSGIRPAINAGLSVSRVAVAQPMKQVSGTLRIGTWLATVN